MSVASSTGTAIRRHASSPRGRVWVLAATLSLVAGVLSAAPASAVPPANDDVANAVVVTGPGTAPTISTREATWLSTDPPCGVATVWWVFRPTESGRYLVESRSHGYDGMLAVLTGSPGALTMRACSDRAGSGGIEQILVTATAGASYFIMAGTCCGPGDPTVPPTGPQVGPGGDQTLRIVEAPPEVRLKARLQSTGEATRLGSARIHGTLQCNNRVPRGGFVFVEVRQRQGDRIVVGSDDARKLTCSTARRGWSVSTENPEYAFRTGVALVRFRVIVCDGITCDQVKNRQVVHLRTG